MMGGVQSEHTMKTYQTNCILTFASGPQAFLDLKLPLETGEDVCRALFLAVAEALRPTHPASELELAYSKTTRKIGTVENNALVKVSMCADSTAFPKSGNHRALIALEWFEEGQGKLYFGDANASTEAVKTLSPAGLKETAKNALALGHLCEDDS